MPFAHLGLIQLRLLAIVCIVGPLSQEEIVEYVRDAWRVSVRDGIKALTDYGLIDKTGTTYDVAAGVPNAHRDLVRSVWSHFEGTDVRYPILRSMTQKPDAFNRAADGAPRVFGTDVRLRNLMALAKYGPLRLLDLRRIVGTDTARVEGRDNAPFGRAGLVRTFGEGQDRAAVLDRHSRPSPRYCGCSLPSKRAYPVPDYTPSTRAPKPPKKGPWQGDRHNICGSAIPTAVLTSLRVIDWTFEALCTKLATGYGRVVVKNAMKRLEDDGILQGDRPRKPGFNVRVVTIADDFPARQELLDLLKACAKAWPQIGKSVEVQMRALHPRTKAHLQKRGLV